MAEARVFAGQLSHLPEVISNDRIKHVVDITACSVQATVLQEGAVVFIPHPLTLLRSLTRSLYRFRNKLVDLLWPLGPYSASAVVLAFSATVVRLPSSSWFRSGLVAQTLWDWDSSIPWVRSNIV